MSKRIVLVDDDQDILSILKMEMQLDGHEVRSFVNSLEALESIISEPPDCVLTDIMMPEMDGVELCQKLRAEPALEGLKIVVVSGKIYHTDRQRALDAGADGFIVKSRSDPGSVVKQVLALLSDEVVIKFWGCRGTIPVPGPETLKYGGNTSCVSMTFPDNHIFVFDAGSGIKPLANHIMKSGKKNVTGTFFLSHPHWDHINFFPFFTPLFVPGNQFTVVGSPVQGQSVEELIGNQMGGVHFPITPREFGAQVLYKDVGEGNFSFGPCQVETMLLCHPGNCLGYSIKFEQSKVCYVTDNELFPPDTDMFSSSYLERLTEFCRDADLLITDVTYFDDQYASRMGWGHSSVTPVCEMAHAAGVKELLLFHHDPDQTDADLDRKLGLATGVLEALGSETKARLATSEQELRISSAK